MCLCSGLALLGAVAAPGAEGAGKLCWKKSGFLYGKVAKATVGKILPPGAQVVP